MIDLSRTVKSKLFPIKLVDGEIMKLKAPSQKMLINMVELGNGEMDTEEQLKVVYDIILKILNRNINDRHFDLEQVSDEIDLQTAMIVIEEYLKFFYGDVQKKS